MVAARVLARSDDAERRARSAGSVAHGHRETMRVAVERAVEGEMAGFARPFDLAKEALCVDRRAVRQGEVAGLHEGHDVVAAQMVDEQTTRCRPGEGHALADIGGDAERARALAHGGDVVPVAVEAAELRGLASLGDDALQRSVDGRLPARDRRIGGAQKMQLVAQEQPSVAAILQHAALQQDRRQFVDGGARRAEQDRQLVGAKRAARVGQRVQHVEGAVEPPSPRAARLRLGVQHVARRPVHGRRYGFFL